MRLDFLSRRNMMNTQPKPEMETNSSNKLSTLVKKVPSSPREFFAKLYESAEQEDAQIKIDAEETPKLRKLFVPGVKKVGESRPGEKVMLETSSLIWTNYYSPPPPTGRSRHENIGTFGKYFMLDF